MLRWLADALDSSVGRKALVGLTGLGLFGFLLVHLAGNLTLFADSDGAAFNGYVEMLASYGALLYVAEIALGLLFLAHIVLALRLNLQNREARKERYVVRASHGRQTPGSTSMVITGLVVGAYLVMHLLDFRLDPEFGDDPAALTKAKLDGPRALLYLAGLLALGLHLSHGIRSAFQSLGASHPRWNVLLERAGLALAVLIPLAFASFPLYYWLLWDGGVS